MELTDGEIGRMAEDLATSKIMVGVGNYIAIISCKHVTNHITYFTAIAYGNTSVY